MDFTIDSALVKSYLLLSPIILETMDFTIDSALVKSYVLLSPIFLNEINDFCF